MKSLPEFFELERFQISPGDVTRMMFRCDPDRIHPDVILLPWWQPGVFGSWVEGITTVTANILYETVYAGKPVSILRSGIGAPQAGDTALALGCTPCERILFAGSVGGLRPEMQVGDLMLPEFSYAGDGFCRYLEPGFPDGDSFLEHVFPDAALSANLARSAAPLCAGAGITLHTGPVYCTDSILAQFGKLDYMIDTLGCIGIEMETSAVFKAARQVGIRAAALFSISDVPIRNKTLYAGRTEQEKKFRLETRSQVLAKAVMDSLGG